MSIKIVTTIDDKFSTNLNTRCCAMVHNAISESNKSKKNKAKPNPPGGDESENSPHSNIFNGHFFYKWPGAEEPKSNNWHTITRLVANLSPDAKLVNITLVEDLPEKLIYQRKYGTRSYW